MRKLVSILLVLICCFALTACGEEKELKPEEPKVEETIEVTEDKNIQEKVTEEETKSTSPSKESTKEASKVNKETKKTEATTKQEEPKVEEKIITKEEQPKQEEKTTTKENQPKSEEKTTTPEPKTEEKFDEIKFSEMLANMNIFVHNLYQFRFRMDDETVQDEIKKNQDAIIAILKKYPKAYVDKANEYFIGAYGDVYRSILNKM